jgi:thiamine transporter
MQKKTKRLTESAMLIAIAVVLELAGKMLIPPMPFGGQLTLCAMLPIVLISYRHGVRWGLTSGFAYALVQMALGAGTVTAAFQPGYFGDGTMVGRALIMCLMDYILAYSALGLGGCFRNRLSKGPALLWGSIVALGSRYLAHILSGYILFAGWAEWFFTQEGFPGWGAQLVQTLAPDTLGWLYSIVYNGLYMIPEMVITTAVALMVAKIPGAAEKIS